MIYHYFTPSNIDKLARFLLGAILIFSGINYFLDTLTWYEMSPDARFFVGALLKTNYLFPFIKSTQIFVGLLFIFNRFVNLGIIFISPIIVNIFLFHVFLEPNGLHLSILFIVLISLMVIFRKESFIQFIKS